MTPGPISVVDTLLHEVVGAEAERGPTGAVLAIEAGDGSRTRTCGWAQTHADSGRLADPPPVTAHTVFDIGSVTKVAVTVVALLRLHDAGALDVDAPVRRFRPGFSSGAKGDVTVRQLLQHRGGLWEWWPLYLRAQDRAGALRAVDRLPLRYRPGSGRHYSDLGFMLLGSVVEEVAGAELREAARRLVFEPLGMSSTGYAGAWLAHRSVAATSKGDVHEQEMIATGVPYPVRADPVEFSFARRHFLRGEANDGNAFHAFGGVAGHAGLFSTAGDLCRLGAALSPHGGAGLCSSEAMAVFTSEGPDQGQALGLRTRRVGGHRFVEHPGFPGAFWGLDLDTGVCLTLLTNRLHPQSTPVPQGEQWLRCLESVVGRP